MRSPTLRRIVLVVYLPLLAALVVLTIANSRHGQDATVVALYLAAGCYALVYRAWVAVAASAAVAAVRTMAAYNINSGLWFSVASIVFVGLFFLLVAQVVHDRAVKR